MIRSNNEENEDKNAEEDLREEARDFEANSQEQMKERADIKQDDKFQMQQSSANRSKRNPFCSRCRNHGKSAQVKGHKRHCEYRECQCYGCRLVEQRQQISAQQIKMRRNQKQDEEYGRRIEISPPVLTRPQKTDTTLLQTIAHGVGGVPSALLQNTAPIINASTALKPSLSHPDETASTLPSTQYSHLLEPQLGLVAGNYPRPARPPFDNNARLGAAFNQTAPATIASSTLIPPTTSAPSEAMAGSSCSLSNAVDQLEMAQEMHKTFGSLAIYAWLRLEQFDFQKVRRLIELSRTSYNDLINSKLASTQQSGQVDSSNGSSSYSLSHDKDDFSQCGEIADLNRQKYSVQSSSQRDCKDDSANKHVPPSSSTNHLQPPTSSQALMSSSPIYTVGNTTNYLNLQSGSRFLDELDKASINLVGQPAHQHTSLSSASLSLSNALAAQTQSIFWPNLKLTNGGIGPAPLIPPHLMPHFMQHHSFLAQQTQQHQLTLNSLSKGGNSTSGSSSSALL